MDQAREPKLVQAPTRGNSRTRHGGNSSARGTTPTRQNGSKPRGASPASHVPQYHDPDRNLTADDAVIGTDAFKNRVSEITSFRVVARVRPFIKEELAEMEGQERRSIVEMTNTKTILLDPKDNWAPKAQFEFDASLWSIPPTHHIVHTFQDTRHKTYATQKDVYNLIAKDLVPHVFNCFNSCILTYGQTGSGKTYTMMGNYNPNASCGGDGEEGIIPRVSSDLFVLLKEREDEEAQTKPQHERTKFRVEVSFVEIYMERVRDLLDPALRHTRGNEKLQDARIRQDPYSGPFVEGVTKYQVENWAQCCLLLERGSQHRTTCATAVHNQSSRSHAIYQITVLQEQVVPGKNKYALPSFKTQAGRINLVDLAGSERGGFQDYVKESAAINTSLLALRRVIDNLTERQNMLMEQAKAEITGGYYQERPLPQVPFRDSVLTWLLSDSIGGNARTTMVATLSPLVKNYGDTLATLQWSSKARNLVTLVKMNDQTMVSDGMANKAGALDNAVRIQRQNLDSLRQTLRQKQEDAKQLEKQTKTLTKSLDKTNARLRAIKEDRAALIIQRTFHRFMFYKKYESYELHFAKLRGSKTASAADLSEYDRIKAAAVAREQAAKEQLKQAEAQTDEKAAAVAKYEASAAARAERKREAEARQAKIRTTINADEVVQQYAEKRKAEATAMRAAMEQEKEETAAREQKVREMERVIAESNTEAWQNQMKKDAEDLEALRKKRDEVKDRRYAVLKELLEVREKHKKMFKTPTETEEMLSEEEQKRQLYNRQEYVVGTETQAKYGSTNVLVVGATGLGAEIIKNIVLTGVKSVKILDDTKIGITDCSTNFFVRAADVGKTRAAVVAQAAKELNRFVDVVAVTGDALAHIPEAHVVIFTNHYTSTLVEANRVARAHGVKFISCESRGVCASIFVDGGETLDIVDKDGEDTVTCVVTALSPDGLVTLHEDKNHECEVGSNVYFTGLSSLPQADTVDPSTPASWKLFEVAEVISPHILRLKGVKELMEAAGDGAVHSIDVGTSAYLHTTKKGRREHYLTLEESLPNPACLMIFDKEEKLTAATTLHAMFTAVAQHGHAPTSPAEVETIVQLAQKNNKEADISVMRLLLPAFGGDLNPMACFIGGIAAQEVLKVCSGKFTPLHQWLYYDAREVLLARLHGVKAVEPSMAATAVFPDLAATPSRYSGQEAVLGHAFQKYLHHRNAFIVGAGALGCELIKNVALMGFGEVAITDMDSIEMSNLSRQFLFRHHHIGRPKSVVAAEAARHINHEVRITAYESKMAPETEAIFNEEFWAEQSVVLNALDNVMSRKYVDGRCLFYQRPLFESGTLGTKCNMQPVIPFVTESYSSSYDPPEKGIPLCTLKNFPNAIEHTIQWARDLFHLLFASVPADVNQYLDNPQAFAHNLKNDPAAADTIVKNVNDALVHWPKDDHDCVKMARLLYQEHFNDSFRQLLYNIPLDKRNDDGQLFWSGAKKPPTPQAFSAENEQDRAFVYHCACLFAEVYQLPKFALTEAETAKLAANVNIPEFVPRHAVFATSEKQTSQQTSSTSGLTFEQLPPASHFGTHRMKAEDFDKDNSANHHVQFITYCSNMRARAYHIPVADLYQTKRIAGNIIPAMVTTTSLVTGLVGFELLKYLLLQFHHYKQHSPDSPKSTAVYLEADEDPAQLVTLYRSAFVNLALPLIAFSDPIVAQSRTYALPSGKKLRWGIWDRLEVSEGRDMPVKQLVQLLHERYELEVFMIALTNGKMIYTEFGGKAKDKEKRLSEVAQEKGETLHDGIDYFDLVVTGMIGDDDDVDVPIIRYRYRF